MEQQCILLDAVRRLVPEVNYLSASLQIKVLGKLREMFAVMKEQAKLIRAPTPSRSCLFSFKREELIFLLTSTANEYIILP